MIRFSDVLSNDYLEQIIQTQEAQKQTAIAQRETVSERISGALPVEIAERLVSVVSEKL